jgi:AcrR family transcriptional regulator
MAARAANAEIRRAQTRARLLETAAEVLAAKCPAPPSVEDFASAAGVSRGTVYNYFDTPDELIDALRAELGRKADEQLTAAMAATEDPAIQLALFARYFLNFAVRSPTQAAAFLHVENLEGSRRPATKPDSWRGAFEDIIRRGMEAGRFRKVDPWAAHALVFGAGRVVMRDILHDAAPPGHGARVLALALVGLGLPAVEADLIAEKVLGEVNGEPASH